MTNPLEFPEKEEKGSWIRENSKKTDRSVNEWLLMYKMQRYWKEKGMLGTVDWVTGGNLEDGKRLVGFIERWHLRKSFAFKSGFWVI